MLGGSWGHEVDKLRKAKTPRGGEPWSKAEDVELVRAYREGSRPEDLAGKHGRTPAACVSRLVRLDVLIAHKGAYWERPAQPFVTVREMIAMAER